MEIKFKLKTVNFEKKNPFQVDVIHVSQASKNAADKKLKSLIKRFIRDFKSNPLKIILLTGDKEGFIHLPIFLINFRNKCKIAID